MVSNRRLYYRDHYEDMNRYFVWILTGAMGLFIQVKACSKVLHYGKENGNVRYFYG